jgi:hypothetical protein
MRLRDLPVVAFVLFILGSVFFSTFWLLEDLLGYGLAGLVATVAFVAAMEILEQSPPIRRVTGKWRQREMRAEYQRQDRFMRRLLEKSGLLPPGDDPGRACLFIAVGLWIGAAIPIGVLSVNTWSGVGGWWGALAALVCIGWSLFGFVTCLIAVENARRWWRGKSRAPRG